jgi:flagellar assembly factor FliW
MTGEFPKSFTTSRFGTIPVDARSVITFPEGVLGFPDARRYILLETSENGVFFWLQSLDNPTLAFVVIDPELLVKDYRKSFTLSDRDREFFAPAVLSDLSSMAIVTFSGGPDEEVTANLQGPLLVREKDRHGRQVVIPEADSWLRTPVFGSGKKKQDSP